MHLRTLTFVLLVSSVLLRPIAEVAPREFDAASIDGFVTAEMAAQRVPGLALAIVHGDQLLHMKGYGTAGNGQPVTPSTQFFIASVTKSITALAVMQLVEEGKVDLDAPVQRYVPEFTLAEPEHAAILTVRQLLYQVSGLADAGFPESMLPQPRSIAERIESLRSARPVAAPGAEFHYFNPNYGVLARVVEAASGQPYAGYLQTNVFLPLRMNDSFAAITSTEGVRRSERLAQGHIVIFGVTVPVDEMDGFLAGSGDVVSTAADMANYLIVHTNGGRFEQTVLVAPEAIDAMHTPPRQPDSEYAMGWLNHTVDGVPVIEHNGTLSAFYSDAVMLPESGYGFVVLANVNGAMSSFVGLAKIKRGLIALLTGGQPAGDPFNVGVIGVIMGVITLLGAGLALRALLRLPRWAQENRSTPWWRLLPGIVWSFVPGLVLLALPALFGVLADRAFGHAILARSIPDVTIWLGVTGVLGAIIGIARLVVLVRRRGGKE